MVRLISLVLFFCFCLASCVRAVGFMLKEENDTFAIPGSDYYYSQGLDITFAADAKKKDDMVSRKLYGVRNLIYTPLDISIAEPQPWDRPWAGMSVLFYTDWSLTKGVFTTEQWMLGVVGEWSQSDHIQTWFHKMIGSVKPMGWANQIPNEPILNYSWSTFHSIWSFGDEKKWSMDLTKRYGYSLGNAFVQGEGGFLGRVGWNVPQDYRMGLIQPTLTTSGFFEKMSIYAFGEVDGRISLHNITLGGSLFQDGPSQELRNFIFEDKVGASFTMRDIFGSKTDLDLSYSMIFRSKEFVGQEKNMEYGSITIALLRGF
jgi:lipid A 3-O-deacylase